MTKKMGMEIKKVKGRKWQVKGERERLDKKK